MSRDTAIRDATEVVKLVGDPGWGSVIKLLAAASAGELAEMRTVLVAGYNAVCGEEQRRRREGR